MELEGTLELERPPTRRWVPIVAVVLPVVAFVTVAAWFVRAFIAPPMVAIPSPTMVAAAPAPARAEVSAPEPQPPNAVAERIASTPAAVQASVHTPGVSMIASLSAAPPTLASASSVIVTAAPPPMTPPPATTAYAAPTPDVPSAAEIEPSEPIQGPIPLPLPRRPRMTVAHAALGPVPLPRPRPAEAAPRPEPEAQSFERHSVQ